MNDFKSLTPEQVDYATLQPTELVNLFGLKIHRNQAIVALVGGLTASELRNVTLSERAFRALVEGLEHRNPNVRWWCLQLMDHVGDERCFPYILKMLDDPITRVAYMAQHALECDKCKASPEMAARARAALEGHQQL